MGRRAAPTSRALVAASVQARTSRWPGASQPVPAQSQAPSTEAIAVDAVDMQYLQGLLGYNARRAALAIIDVFLQRMAVYGLRPVDFSVMSVIHHNPGVTSRQLCAALNLLPPNLVGLIQALQTRGLIEKMPHPRDRRAFGLHPTALGRALMTQAEATAVDLESELGHRLSTQERQTLLELLQKIYL